MIVAHLQRINTRDTGVAMLTSPALILGSAENFFYCIHYFE